MRFHFSKFITPKYRSHGADPKNFKRKMISQRSTVNKAFEDNLIGSVLSGMHSL